MIRSASEKGGIFPFEVSPDVTGEEAEMLTQLWEARLGEAVQDQMQVTESDESSVAMPVEILVEENAVEGLQPESQSLNLSVWLPDELAWQMPQSLTRMTAAGSAEKVMDSGVEKKADPVMDVTAALAQVLLNLNRELPAEESELPAEAGKETCVVLPETDPFPPDEIPTEIRGEVPVLKPEQTVQAVSVQSRVAVSETEPVHRVREQSAPEIAVENPDMPELPQAAEHVRRDVTGLQTGTVVSHSGEYPAVKTLPGDTPKHPVERIKYPMLKQGEAIEFRLDPPQLGLVRIQIVSKNGETQVQIEAVWEETTNLLKQHTQEIRDLFQEEGLPWTRVNVETRDTTRGSSLNMLLNQEQYSLQQQKQDQRQQQNEQKRQTLDMEQESFESELSQLDAA